jgi:hypothetical protein
LWSRYLRRGHRRVWAERRLLVLLPRVMHCVLVRACCVTIGIHQR